MSIPWLTRCVTAALMAAFLGCAPYIGTCAWLVPKADGAIKVVGPRRPVAGGECNCIGCNAPGEFLLKREQYTIELWNGDRWYPQLFIRARDSQGRRLTIRSARLLRNRPTTPIAERYTAYDYFLDFPISSHEKLQAGPQEPLVLTILGPGGVEVATERLELTLVVRRDISLDWL